jgi:hypothetical protein
MMAKFFAARPGLKAFLSCAALLAILLGFLFARALFNPDYVVFSNDGPYGAMVSEHNQMPGILTGIWQDLNWLGGPYPSPSIELTTLLRWAVSTLCFAKILAPYSLFVSGICAWYCFWQYGFSRLACLLAAIAAALNSDFVGTSAWGVCHQTVAFGMNFLALGAVADTTSPRRWLRVILAGFCVGLGVIYAWDIGALFSLFTGTYVVMQAFLTIQGNTSRRIGLGVSRLAIVGIFAALISTHALISVVGFQIKGTTGVGRDTESKEARWSFATQYSIPKAEALGIMFPGLFGFRHDTPNGGEYWGRGGSDPSWDEFVDSGGQRGRPSGAFRAGAGSHYAGAVVVMLAIFALVQSFRKQGGPLSQGERKLVWFWGAVVAVALLLMFGRFAPFYQLFYAVPYVSTIRNPAKFVHIVEWALIILFAYGIEALYRIGFGGVVTNASGVMATWKSWWSKAMSFDRRWVIGSVIGLALVALAWLFYASSHDALERHISDLTNLQYAAMGQKADQAAVSEMAAANARHSIYQVGRTVVFLVLVVLLVSLTLSGYFRGARAKFGIVLFVVLMIVDLVPINRPWIVFVNQRVKYESNPVIDFLRARPYEQRVTIFPLEKFVDFRRLPREMMPLAQQCSFFAQIYGIEWTQQLFQFYNIQNLEVVQEPRVPQDKAAYEAALLPASPVRRWELANTRYLLGPAAFVDSINQQLDAGKSRFLTALRFDLAAKTGVDQSVPQSEQVTAVINTNGQLAVIDFSGALPRAKLYANWKVSTNDPAKLRAWATNIQARVPKDWGQALGAQSETDLATLHELADPAFDPAQTVLLAEPLPVAPGTNQIPGEVKFENYDPKFKHIVLNATANMPCVLLLNDKYNPDWKVTVDGRPAKLLRVNFIARGVFLDKPGEHRVEFNYQVPRIGFWISTFSFVVAVGLFAFVGLRKSRD